MLTMTLKKLLENVLRFETGVVLNSLLSRFHLRGQTHDAGSVTRISLKYKLMGFRINFFKNDFSVYYFVFVHS